MVGSRRTDVPYYEDAEPETLLMPGTARALEYELADKLMDDLTYPVTLVIPKLLHDGTGSGDWLDFDSKAYADKTALKADIDTNGPARTAPEVQFARTDEYMCQQVLMLWIKQNG